MYRSFQSATNNYKMEGESRKKQSTQALSPNRTLKFGEQRAASDHFFFTTISFLKIEKST